MLVETVITVFASIALSLGLNRLMLTMAPKLGLMDQPGERRIHSTAIPRAGGIAVWLSFMVVTCAVLLISQLGTSGHLSWGWYRAFGLSSLVLVVAGIFDDHKGLPPLVKLSAHILAPGVFFACHPVSTGLFPAGWPIIWDFAVFVIWTVMLINAFNLIDGLDGLCGGLAAMAVLCMGGMALVNGREDSAILLFVMGGSILGFLRYNFNPARIFLGDAGSMTLGFFIATVATEAVGRRAVVGVLLLPIAVAGVPLLDVLLAVWRRSARRVVKQLKGEDSTGGLFDADKDHLHHRLLAAGGSQRKVAIILQGVAILLAVLAFLPMLFGDRMLAMSLVGFLIVGLVGVRHLARVEIEHTGSVVHMAIKLPGHRRRVAVALFGYDFLVLMISALIGVIIETNCFTRSADWMVMTRFILLFTILGAIATLVSKIHMRLWVRATIRDLLSLQFWILTATLGTFTLFSLAFSSLEWSALRMALISHVFATIGVSLPRVLLDLFRDFGLEARHRNPKPSKSDGHGPVVVVGAGDLGTLLLDHLKSSSHEAYPGLKVLGFLDETRIMHGRRLRSFRVLGDMSLIPKLVEEQGLRGIVLAINRPRRDLMERLETVAEAYDLRIYRWKVGIHPIESEPVAAWTFTESHSPETRTTELEPSRA